MSAAPLSGWNGEGLLIGTPSYSPPAAPVVTVSHPHDQHTWDGGGVSST